MKNNSTDKTTFYLLCLLLRINPVFSTLAATHLIVTHAGPCDGETDMLILMNELAVATQNYDSSFSGTINLTQDVDNGWKVKATVQKCADIRNTDTCDFFQAYYLVKNGCNNDDDDEYDLYSMFFHYIEPVLECPLRAGTYKLSNYPIFTEDNYITVNEAKISTSIFGYTYTLDGYTNDYRKIFCVEAHLQLLYMRDHNWLEKRNKSHNHIMEERDGS